MVVGDGGNSTVQDVVFVVEGTANLGAYIDGITQSYIKPSLEYFSGGPPDEVDYGFDYSCTLYNLVVFYAADCAPAPPVNCIAPTTSTHEFLQWMDQIPFVGGGGEACSHISEGLSTALQVFDDLNALRENCVNTQKHCVLVCNSPPYQIPSQGNSKYSGFVAEQLAAMLGERGVNLSVMAPRKLPVLQRLYDKASSDVTLVSNKDYTKDPRHLVLLKGYHLQERAPSPSSEKEKASAAAIAANTTIKQIGSPAPGQGMTNSPKPGTQSTIPKKVNSPAGAGDGPFKVPTSTVTSQPGPPAQGQNAPMRPNLTNTVSSQQGVMPGNQQRMAAPNQLQNQQQQQQQIPPMQNPMVASGPRGPPPAAQEAAKAVLAEAMGKMQQPNSPAVVPTPQQKLTSQVQQQPNISTQSQMISSQMGQSQPTPMMTSQPQIMTSQMSMPGQMTSQSQMMPSQNPSQMMTQPNMMTSQQQVQVNPPQQPQMTSQHQVVSQAMPLQQQQQQPQQQAMTSQQQALTSQQQALTSQQLALTSQHQALTSQQQTMTSQQQLMTSQQFNTTQQQIVTSHQQMPQTQQILSSKPLTATQQLQQIQLQQKQVTQAPLITPQQQQPGVNTQNIQMMQQPQQPQQQPGMNLLVSSQPQGMMQSQNPGMPPQNVQPKTSQPQMREPKVVWRGTLEWQEKNRAPAATNAGPRVSRSLPCEVCINTGDTDLNTARWPQNLIMQLIPQQLLAQLQPLFKQSKNVGFRFSQTDLEALGNLQKIMSSGFAGCVHFPNQTNCEIRVLMLLYSTKKDQFIGMIPHDQASFVNGIRTVIQSHKTAQQQKAQQKIMSIQQQQQLQAAAAAAAPQPQPPQPQPQPQQIPQPQAQLQQPGGQPFQQGVNIPQPNSTTAMATNMPLVTSQVSSALSMAGGQVQQQQQAQQVALDEQQRAMNLKIQALQQEVENLKQKEQQYQSDKIKAQEVARQQQQQQQQLRNRQQLQQQQQRLLQQQQQQQQLNQQQQQQQQAAQQQQQQGQQQGQQQQGQQQQGQQQQGQQQGQQQQGQQQPMNQQLRHLLLNQQQQQQLRQQQLLLQQQQQQQRARAPIPQVQPGLLPPGGQQTIQGMGQLPQGAFKPEDFNLGPDLL